VNFRLEELEGQSVLKWFKDEFGAKGNIEFAPKFKSNRGFIKGKLVTTADPEHRSARQLGRHQ
jgi:hypothetical protein